MATQDTLNNYLNRRYRFDVVGDPDGGYVIEYPDLPGCMTQVESIEEVGTAAQDVFELWIEAALDNGISIHEPSRPQTHSGKFVLRLPKSLHRRLAERASDEGVSLNQLTLAILAEGIGLLRNDETLQSPGTGLRAMMHGIAQLSESSSLHAVVEELEIYDEAPTTLDQGSRPKASRES